ncbi:MAG: hypothetical protein ABGY75_06945, partial [Gemmataceae bacterium]
VKVKAKSTKLSSVIEYCVGRVAPDVVYDEGTKQLSVDMEDDLVIRKDAPLEMVVPDLQKALAGGGLNVVLTLMEEEHEVYAVGGKFEIKPREWREKNEVDVYSDEAVMNKAYSHKWTQPDHAVNTVWYQDTPREFVRTVGAFLDKRVVFDANLPDTPRFNSYLHSRWEKKATAEEWKTDHDPEKVLVNVSEQTGLTFKKEKRKVPVLHVSVPK